jgi:hypothetical protein
MLQSEITSLKDYSSVAIVHIIEKNNFYNTVDTYSIT